MNLLLWFINELVIPLLPFVALAVLSLLYIVVRESIRSRRKAGS